MQLVIFFVALILPLVAGFYSPKVLTEGSEEDSDGKPQQPDNLLDLFAGRNGARDVTAELLRKRKQDSKATNHLPSQVQDLLKNAYSSPGLQGDVLYTARKQSSIRFSLEHYDGMAASDIVIAHLHLYQIQPKKPIRQKKRKSDAPDESKEQQAKVSVHEITKKGKKLTSVTRVLDSRIVSLYDSGWMSFDITVAVKAWLENPSANKGLEVWIESVAPGKFASRVARKNFLFWYFVMLGDPGDRLDQRIWKRLGVASCSAYIGLRPRSALSAMSPIE
ncbi:hypothetical protein CAPTEDRAFT_198732 [Capitella teleta]|uniref:TGF-beta propeptide domain-containing protein n=1 Tax=Capitella teleta TaxID=283909 RepID=R7VB49_CAPTE|nr:hypothetical protein CAPTEDRAFT_198732 [Capitella teleta]|eukprot:ELU12930.1 hypothetical protein CAPTEDRAFT_198732 [Capitella teleta]